LILILGPYLLLQVMERLPVMKDGKQTTGSINKYIK